MKRTFSVALILCLSFNVLAKEVYQCSVNGSITFQEKPCKDIKAKQKVSCLNYGQEVNFKEKLKEECIESSSSYGGYDGGYSSSTSNYGSNYSGTSSSYGGSSRSKNQYVSGYTRKDGTYVQSYRRASKR